VSAADLVSALAGLAGARRLAAAAPIAVSVEVAGIEVASASALPESGFGFRLLLASLPPDSPMRESLAEMLRTKPIQAFVRPADRMFPLKAGDVLFEGAPDTDPDEHMEFRFEVAFGEPQILEGEPLLETVHQMADLIGNVVATFKPLLS
jgi:hypothetical protein